MSRVFGDLDTYQVKNERLKAGLPVTKEDIAAHLNNLAVHMGIATWPDLQKKKSQQRFDRQGTSRARWLGGLTSFDLEHTSYENSKGKEHVHVHESSEGMATMPDAHAPSTSNAGFYLNPPATPSHHSDVHYPLPPTSMDPFWYPQFIYEPLPGSPRFGPGQNELSEQWSN